MKIYPYGVLGLFLLVASANAGNFPNTFALRTEPNTACAGVTLQYLGSDYRENHQACIDACISHSSCQCVSIHKEDGECRLESGPQSYAHPDWDAYDCIYDTATEATPLGCPPLPNAVYRPDRHCGGQTLADLPLLSYDSCIDACVSNPSCKCVTVNLEYPSCKIETGPVVVGPNTGHFAYECVYGRFQPVPSGCPDPGWQINLQFKPSAACGGQILADLGAISLDDCAQACVNNAQCSCITVNKEDTPQCRLETGPLAVYQADYDAYECVYSRSQSTPQGCPTRTLPAEAVPGFPAFLTYPTYPGVPVPDGYRYWFFAMGAAFAAAFILLGAGVYRCTCTDHARKQKTADYGFVATTEADITVARDVV
jgi:hypothetical protein